MKGVNYLASVVKTYRNAIDAYFKDPSGYRLDPEWQSELYQVFHRAYCTGFYFGHPDEAGRKAMNPSNAHQGKIHSFIGKIRHCDENNRCLVEIRNKVTSSDTLQILSPEGPAKETKILALTNFDHDPIESAQPNTKAFLHLAHPCSTNDIIRKI